jgi:hypothetical protein
LGLAQHKNPSWQHFFMFLAAAESHAHIWGCEWPERAQLGGLRSQFARNSPKKSACQGLRAAKESTEAKFTQSSQRAAPPPVGSHCISSLIPSRTFIDGNIFTIFFRCYRAEQSRDVPDPTELLFNGSSRMIGALLGAEIKGTS